jgi:predicted N-acyltransferase
MSTTVPTITTTPVTGSRLFPDPDAARKIHSALQDLRSVIEISLMRNKDAAAEIMFDAVEKPDSFLARGFTHNDRACLVFVASYSQ